MCGRSSLTKTEKEIEQRFNATFYSDELERYNPIPNFNVAPTQKMPVVTAALPDKLQIFQWGLIPSWSKDAKMGFSLINARVETLEEKPMFRLRLKAGRCLVPMDGFYEWKRNDKVKVPFWITTKDQQIFSVAGLWDQWIDGKSGQTVRTYTVITVEPNTLMQTIHNRMPAMLLPEFESSWLDENLGTKEVLQVLQPYPSDAMQAFEVSSDVNSVKNNNPSLIQPVTVRQMTLF